MILFEFGYVYTRFRAVGGIRGLTSDHISYSPCPDTCNGVRRGGQIGYVNDDMVRVVPGALIDFAFASTPGPAFGPDGQPTTHQVPETWLDLTMQEGMITRFWLD